MFDYLHFVEPMSPAPNFFSSRHGSGVELSENNTQIHCTTKDNAVAYTAQPIPENRQFQLTVIEPGIIVSYLASE